MIRLGLTDGRASVRKKICDMAALSRLLRVTHCWANAAETLHGLTNANIQVLLLDINLPDMKSDQLCSGILNRMPNIKIIGLSNLNQSIDINKFIDAGAAAYLTENASLWDLETVVKTIPGNGHYSGHLAKERYNKVDGGSDGVRLTRREEDILKLIAMEYTTREIADQLFVSQKTVETHRAHLFQKLRVRNLAGLVREAILHGYIS